ncbi:hypothetical protein CYY_002726 [Polysphondylium violaceum]|uniref:Peroxisomal biogenesis factor 11 family protein n=1 Tax=Polysphondylium violaceum TaxID=133409 RepID=A0A8J4PYD1_9MYCE|nr:hypothetical protein CYY_002726 [Polysphondylium violaceum]
MKIRRVDKIIQILQTLDGRDKIFKFIQYFSKILVHLIERKQYIKHFVKSILFTIVYRKRYKSSHINSINSISTSTSLVLERLGYLESCLYDARLLYRLGGFFQEFKSLVSFISSLKSTKATKEQQIDDNDEKKRSLINRISNSLFTTLELIDLGFSFISELTDVIFWGTKIKIFKLSIIGIVGQVSDFIWVYSLVLFILRIVYQLVYTHIKLLNTIKEHKKQKELINGADIQISSNNNNNNNKSNTCIISTLEKEIKVLRNSRSLEIVSLIRAIGEFGLCICSVYEIENNALIGVSGCVSAIISLQEIWKETKIDGEDKDDDNSDDDTSNEHLQHEHVCPPVVHLHSNPN